MILTQVLLAEPTVRGSAPRDAGTSVGQGGQKKCWGQYKLTKNKKIVTNYQARRPTRWGA